MNDGYSAAAPGQSSEAIGAQDSASLGQARTAGRVRQVRAGPQALTHRDKRLIAIGMMVPVFLGSVDQSILASALPRSGASSAECTICLG